MGGDFMNPINNAAAVSSSVEAYDRRDNVSQVKTVTATVTEDEADVTARKSENANVVQQTEASQAKPRDEDRGAPKDQSQGREEKRGNLTDIYV
jgi:hypothetical protein